jgi:hypothetical protein
MEMPHRRMPVKNWFYSRGVDKIMPLAGAPWHIPCFTTAHTAVPPMTAE